MSPAGGWITAENLADVDTGLEERCSSNSPRKMRLCNERSENNIRDSRETDGKPQSRERSKHRATETRHC